MGARECVLEELEEEPWLWTIYAYDPHKAITILAKLGWQRMKRTVRSQPDLPRFVKIAAAQMARKKK